MYPHGIDVVRLGLYIEEFNYIFSRVTFVQTLICEVHDGLCVRVISVNCSPQQILIIMVLLQARHNESSLLLEYSCTIAHSFVQDFAEGPSHKHST